MQNSIKDKICTIRNMQVMLDRDLGVIALLVLKQKE